jgi:hypothetical protein
MTTENIYDGVWVDDETTKIVFDFTTGKVLK